jgi:ABC-2 type transport system permease protein
MRRAWALAHKEFLHIARDRRTLRLLLFMPLVQLLLYGYGIRTDVKHLPLAVEDLDRTPLSRRYTEALASTETFDVFLRAEGLGTLARAMDRGDVKAVARIPAGFSREAMAGRTAAVQFLIDGTDSTPANAAMAAARSATDAFARREGLTPPVPTAIDARPRLWYNPELRTSHFMVPGVVGLLLQLLIPMITASAVVREKERGTLESLLASPVRPWEVMVGKMIPYTVVAMTVAGVVLGAAHVLFHVPVRGSGLALFLLTLLYTTVCLGLGLWASTIAHNQQQASQIVMMFAAPSILLSGFIFPREAMPAFIQALGRAIPLTYYLHVIRGVALKGLGLGDLLPEAAALAAIAIFLLAVSASKFNRRLG